MNIFRKIFHLHQWETVAERSGFQSYYNISTGSSRNESVLYRVEKCKCCGARRGLKIEKDSREVLDPDWLEYQIKNAPAGPISAH